MDNHKQLQAKLESPERVAELSPKETLTKIGLGENDVFCDIGAGSGVFTIPAAQITDNMVYALDTKEEFLEIIREKAQEFNLPNIKTIKVIDDNFDIAINTVDFVMLVTVLHEIENKKDFLAKIKKIMKASAKLVIIEIYKQAQMGAPNAPRLDLDEVRIMAMEVGFTPANDFPLSKNYYCVIFNA